MPHRCLWLLIVLCWQAPSASVNKPISPSQAAAKLKTVKIVAQRVGLFNNLEIALEEDGSVITKPALNLEGTNEVWELLKNPTQWEEDSSQRSQKKGAEACYRHRQAEIGSLHVCVVQTGQGPPEYVMHVDWHYSGWDHPVSAAKHVVGECWVHRFFRGHTNYRKMYEAVKRQSLSTTTAASLPPMATP